MKFLYPLCLWLVPFLLAGGFALRREAQRLAARKLRGFGPPERWPRLLRTVDARAKAWKYWLVVAAICLLAVAAARPVHGPRTASAERSGAEFYLVLDVSKSMLTRDVPPDRLDAVKTSLDAWLKTRTGDRIGLILMAGDAFVQAPLTNDYTALREVLAQSGPLSISRGGTNLAGGILTAAAAFQKSDVKRKAVVIVSDGGGLEGDATQAARQAHANDGITIYAVGVGTEDGGPVPEIVRGSPRMDFTKEPAAFVMDEYGVRVNSRLDERSLRTVAEVGGGRYLRFVPPGGVWDTLYTQYLRPLAHNMDTVDLRDYDELFQIPLAAALLLLVLETAFSSRRKNPGPLVSAVILPESAPAASMKAPPRPLKVTGTLLLLFLFAARSAPAASSLSIIEKADGMLKAGQAPDAAKTLWSAAQQKPDDAYLLFDYGVAAYAAKDYTDAIQAFSETSLGHDAKLRLPAFNGLGDAQYRLGRSLRAAKNHEGCITSWEHAVTAYETSLKERDDAVVAHNLAVVKAALEEALMDAGNRSLEHAKGSSDLNQLIPAAGDALEKFDKAASLDPSNGAAGTKREEARPLLANALRDQARGLHDQAQAINTGDPQGAGGGKAQPNAQAAQNKAATGEKDRLNAQAAQSYQHAAETDPQDGALAAEVAHFKSTVANDFNDRAAALLAAATATVEKPAANAAQAAGAANQLTQAVAHTDKALTLDPDNARAQDLQAKALSELEKSLLVGGDLLQARGDALSEKPQTSSNAAQPYQKAADNYQQALELNPANAETRLKLSATHAKLAARLAQEGASEIQQADRSTTPPPDRKPGDDGNLPPTDKLQEGIGHLEKATQTLGQSEALDPGKNHAAELQQKANEKLAALRGKLDQALAKNEADKDQKSEPNGEAKSDKVPGAGNEGKEESKPPGDQQAAERFADTSKTPLNFSEIRGTSEQEGQFGDRTRKEKLRDW